MTRIVLYRSVPVFLRESDGQLIDTGPGVGANVSTGGRRLSDQWAAGGPVLSLCIRSQPSYLGSCEWAQGTMSADLSSGQAVQNLVLHISEGSLVTFEVQDPNSRIRDLADLPAPSGGMAISGANFGIGVFAGLRYTRAALLSTSAGLRQYQLAIPKTASVRLYLDTSLSVLDETGAAAITRAPGAAVAPGGQSEMTINLTVP
jgi:hypothetical protein